MKHARGILSPVTLREVYAEPGTFTAKMIIDPRVSNDIGSVDVTVSNADGRPMMLDSKRWGTKLTVTFKIDETTPDGVAIIDVLMRKNDQPIRERLQFWVVK